MTNEICVTLAIGLVGAAACATAGEVADEASDDSASALRLEYGTTLALTGDLDGAEAVFSSLLSSAGGAAAAWCNLGNVHLIRGEADVAADLYGEALEILPDEPGVLLNRAVARMLVGDVDGSRTDAARAMEGCGGEEKALALLGIEPLAAQAPADEVEHVPFLGEEDVRALLAAAISEVPADSVASSAQASPAGEDAPRSAWRAAGTRAAGGKELGRILHWQY